MDLREIREYSVTVLDSLDDWSVPRRSDGDVGRKYYLLPGVPGDSQVDEGGASYDTLGERYL